MWIYAVRVSTGVENFVLGTKLGFVENLVHKPAWPLRSFFSKKAAERDWEF